MCIRDRVIDLFLTCQIAALVEIINPLVGIVRTGVLAPFMQVLNSFLFAISNSRKDIIEDIIIFFYKHGLYKHSYTGSILLKKIRIW